MTGSPSHSVVVVANRLPIDMKADGEGNITWERSPGGLVTALEAVLKSENAHWIGWSGRPTEEQADDPLPTHLGHTRLSEVPLTQDEVVHYYEGFCNAAIWPLYHDAVVPPIYSRSDWESYRRVNRRFADVVASQAARGATVWVHDYQLQLVPKMLREMRPDLRIGFFLHIPLPPIELFMQLPWRKQVLEGLLGSDLIGFQLPGGAQNFISLCQRLTSAQLDQDDPDALWMNGHKVEIGAFPISVDVSAIEEIARRPETAVRAQQIRSELGNPKKLLLGVDRLDYTKGIDVRLRAMVELMEDRILDPDETVFVQIATPSRQNVEEYQRIRESIASTVGRAVAELGRIGLSPVQYLHTSLPIEELVAFYQAADVMLVTPLRDGMNLVAKEFVASRIDEDGALVLSEFTGAAEELADAWLVNPHDADGVKRSIIQAMRSSQGERQRRMRNMRAYLRDHDVHRWAQEFLDRLTSVDSSVRTIRLEART